MWRKVFCVGATLVAGACNAPDEEERIVHVNLMQAEKMEATPSGAYLDPKDRELAAKPYSGGPVPCEGKRTDQCVMMTEARRWIGLWNNAFEGSEFCPDGDCTDPKGEGRIWLNWQKGPDPDYKTYRVEFIGRRTQYAGRYGHLGMSHHEMIVDRMISAREIREPDGYAPQ